jgi:hypothetical protein
LAERVGKEVGEAGAAAVEGRIARAFELVVSRAPTPAEVARLRRLYDESIAAASVVTAAAASAPDSADASASKAVPAEMRAMRDVAVAIMNLDGALVR